MGGGPRSSIAALCLIWAWRRLLLKLPPASSLDSILTAGDQADLDLAARHIARRIQAANLADPYTTASSLISFGDHQAQPHRPARCWPIVFLSSKLAGSSGSQEWQGGRGARPHKNHVSAVLAS